MNITKIFLNYPNLFMGKISSDNRTLAVSNLWIGQNGATANFLTKKKSGEYSPGKLTGVPISWGLPGPSGGRNNYYYGSRNSYLTNMRFNLSNVKKTMDGITAKIDVKSHDFLRTSISNIGNKELILKLTALDMKNGAFTAVPWIKEIMDDFLTKNPTPWMGGNQNGDNSTYMVPGHYLTEAHCKEIQKALDKGYAFFAGNNKWAPDLTLKTPSFGVASRGNENLSTWVPIVTNKPTIPTLVGKKAVKSLNPKDAPPFMNEMNGRANYQFDFKLTGLKKCKIAVTIAWRSMRYIESVRERTATRRYQETNYANVWVPEIRGLSIVPVPVNNVDVKPAYSNIKGNVPRAYSSGNPDKNPPYELTEFVRVQDRTQKRTAKGGYRGGYQGIKTLELNGNPYCEVWHQSALSRIASGAPITGRTYTKLLESSRRELPMSLETYLALPRPEVDVKPVELGHLYLYRIAEAPAKKVTAEILSDMLLPSMPSLLLAVDSQIRVSSNDSYVSGAECYGPCDDVESIDTELKPGLYTIERKEKCSLGHDPGRSEYTLGFGDHCNEVITIRRMLAQLDVFYDEFRGSFVGSNFDPTPTSDRSRASASRLSGRLG